MTITLHPRYFQVEKASVEFKGMLCAWRERHDLTYLEAIRIVLEACQGSLVRYALRQERHPDDLDKKADEA